MNRRMAGSRNWRFTSGIDVLSLTATDFRVEYSGQAQESGADLSVSLRAVWEHTDFDISGLARRVYLEERLKAIAQTWCGRVGLFETDYGTSNAKSMANVKLVSARPSETNGNELLTYDLEFSYPLNSPNAEIARVVVFNGLTLNASNFIVEYSREDLTEFKPVFRAAAVRVAGGPGLKTIRVIAIKQAVTGVSALAKRQAAEAVVNTWAWTHLGVSATLTIDGTSQGTCHLRNVGAGDLSLPDAVTFELEFVTGYGS
jgi:hypothetical protein